MIIDFLLLKKLKKKSFLVKIALQLLDFFPLQKTADVHVKLMQKCLLFETILWPSMSSAEHCNQRNFKDDGQFRKLSDLWKMLWAIDLNLFILKTDAKDLTLPHSLQIRPRAIADWCKIMWLWVSNSVRSWGHLFRNTSWCKDALTTHQSCFWQDKVKRVQSVVVKSSFKV